RGLTGSIVTTGATKTVVPGTAFMRTPCTAGIRPRSNFVSEHTKLGYMPSTGVTNASPSSDEGSGDHGLRRLSRVGGRLEETGLCVEEDRLHRRGIPRVGGPAPHVMAAL